MTLKEIEIQRALGILRDYCVMVISGDNTSLAPSHVEIIRNMASTIDAEKGVREYYAHHKEKCSVISIDEWNDRCRMHTAFTWYEHIAGELVKIQDFDDKESPREKSRSK